MATARLDKIAGRQRRYLVFDVLIAGLAALMLAIQLVVYTGASVPIAEPSPRMAPETIYIFGSAPTPAETVVQKEAVATVPQVSELPGT